MFLRHAKTYSLNPAAFDIYLKWWGGILFGNSSAPLSTQASLDSVQAYGYDTIGLWDHFIQDLQTHALDVSSSLYAKSRDLNNELRKFFDVGCDDLPKAIDIAQNKHLLEEYARNRTEENKQKFVAGVKLSITRRLDPKPFTESLAIIRENEFFKTYMSTVIDPLYKDKERLAAQNPNDPRVKVLDKTINEIRSVAIVCATRYENEFREKRKISQVFDYQTKSFYKSNVVSIIANNLIEKESLGVHRLWGTKYGKRLLNAIACIPIVGQIVGLIHAGFTGNYFWQTATDAQTTANTVHERARTIWICPTLRRSG